eukprot:TRINITY_DN3075_c0_g1_i1.p1 TRINITY_DN3075_c0_g1~~TRINITY_DN3075_c0_g1_i1.p1  ORF type:complete len:788 (-),score=170.11 TRINITY_DN3075_c0_g1_i1:505-2868(-)
MSRRVASTSIGSGTMSLSQSATDVAIEDLIADIVNNFIGVKVDYNFVIEKLKKEFVFRSSHLSLITDEELKSLKLPLMIYIHLKGYCKRTVSPTLDLTPGSAGGSTGAYGGAPTEEPDTGDFSLEDDNRDAMLELWKQLTKPDFSTDGKASLSTFFDTVWTKWTKSDELAQVVFQSRGFKARVQHLMKLMSIIIKCIESPAGFEALSSYVMPHCIWSIQTSSFSTLALAIIEGFEATLGKECMTPSVKECWVSLLLFIGKLMQNHYKELYKGVPDPQPLYKKSGMAWKKLYTSITPETIYFFKTSDMKKYSEKYSFKMITDIEVVGDDAWSKHTPYCFSLDMGGTKKYFCVSSSAKLDQWVAQISMHIRAYNRFQDHLKGASLNSTPVKKNKSKSRSILSVPSKVRRSEFQVRTHLDAQIKETTSFNLFDSLISPTFVINEEGIVEYLNPSAIELTGYSPSELIGKNIKMLMTPEVAAQHDGYLQAYLTTKVKKIIGIGRNVVLKRADETAVNVHLTVTEHLLTGRRLFIGTLSEINEDKSTTSDDSSEDFSAFNSLLNATIVIDTNGIIRFLNQATENITGYTRTDLLGSNVSVLMSQELAAKHDGFIKRHLETGVNHIIGIGRNVEMMVKDGTLIKVHLEVTEHKNQADGKYFIGSLSVAKDKDLESLLEKERAVLGGLAVPVFIITEDGLIKALNPSAEKEFGYPESKIVGKNINILMIKEHARKHNTYIQNYLATGKAKIIGKSRVVPVKCKDGKVKNCHLSVSVKKHDNVRIFVGMLVVLGN